MKIQAINMHRIGQRKHCNNESFNTGIMKRTTSLHAEDNDVLMLLKFK